MEYGIKKADGKILKGMSREEVYSYMECDSQPGDRIVRKHEGKWFDMNGVEV